MPTTIAGARLAYVMTFDHPHAHNFHLRQPLLCRTNVVGLIYSTRSVVKSRRMLVAHDSRRKQKSYHLNRPSGGSRGLRQGSHCGLFFYVASYVVPQICHHIYAPGALEVARVGHKRYLKPDCQLLIFHARKERQIQLIL